MMRLKHSGNTGLGNTPNRRQVLAIITELNNHLDSYTYLNGRCYDLYLLLRTIWPSAMPYHDGNHVITLIGGRFYDITGQVFETRGFHSMDLAVWKKAHRWSGMNKPTKLTTPPYQPRST